MKLGMWPRLGIVLTVAWMVGGTIYFATDQIGSLMDAYDSGRRLCETLNEQLHKHNDCWAEYRQMMSFDPSPYWWMGAGAAAAIAAAFWIGAGIIYGAARWVLAGRRQEIAELRDRGVSR